MNILNKKAVIRLICAALICAIFSGCSVSENINDFREPETLPPIVRVMFPEGSTVTEIAAILEENLVCPAADFIAQANNEALLGAYGFSIPNPEERGFLLEGYIFPDTYEFYQNEGAERAIKRFLKNSSAKLGENVAQRAKELGYTVDEILIIASVIQAEAGKPAEMGKVSSVIHNRLRSSHLPRLECDATIFYLQQSVKDFVTEERYQQLAQLYNTYKFKGLPAGAINNPGMDAVNAALFPEDTDYYFFASDKNGVYYYGETYEEHLEYCAEAGI